MPGILKILPSFHTGGVEQSTLLVVNYVAEKGLNAYVASAGGLLEKKLSPNVKHITLSLNSKNPFKILYNAIKLKKIISKNNIKIIHAGSRAPAWSAYIAAKLTGIAFVTTYHGAYGQNFCKWHYNRVMALGKPVIVASKYMEQHVLKHYPGTKCVNIPSGIDTEFFKGNQEIEEKSKQLKASWGLEADRKVILLVGRVTRIKGHEFLLRSLACFKTKKAPIVLFVGDSKNTKLIEELKLKANKINVQLLVYQDEPDLRPFYNVADVVIVPTIKPEAFGRVTVEAMSMEKVVIGNNLGASSEIINDPTWIFDSSSTESLSNTINNALSLSASEVQVIGKKNRERAQNLYDVSKLVEGHLKIYNSLLKAEWV